MPFDEPDRGLEDRAARSLERSRGRRRMARAARERRRRRLRRLPGPGAALIVAASLVGVTGLAAAAAEVKRSRAVASSQSIGVLTVGSRGPAVKALQRRLRIRATGRFDQRTRRAVMAFQRRNGLVVDGVAGPRTLAALGLRGPAPTRRPAPDGGVSPRGGGPRSTSETLRRIAQCESGGNPRAIGGGGRYRGKYQFTRETWCAFGGRGDPARAPEAEQDRVAARVLARRGPGAWPRCGRG